MWHPSPGKLSCNLSVEEASRFLSQHRLDELSFWRYRKENNNVGQIRQEIGPPFESQDFLFPYGSGHKHNRLGQSVLGVKCFTRVVLGHVKRLTENKIRRTSNLRVMIPD